MNFGQETENRMKKTIEAVQKELSKVRTGRANVSLLDGIKVDYYGSQMPINQVASVGTPEPRMITIQPWEKTMMPVIDKAIRAANIGLNPITDGNLIRLPIPPLTEERRKELAKQCKKMCEDGKVALRNIRRDINELIKKAEKDKEITEDQSKKELDNIQKITDKHSKQFDEIYTNKEKEIMEV